MGLTDDDSEDIEKMVTRRMFTRMLAAVGAALAAAVSLGGKLPAHDKRDQAAGGQGTGKRAQAVAESLGNSDERISFY
ncbi:MAG: hypothetical protein HY804_11290 [Nitrospinae bacterium]|nr:hypothetical protein [Nitrospinota bacterium]